MTSDDGADLDECRPGSGYACSALEQARRRARQAADRAVSERTLNDQRSRYRHFCRWARSFGVDPGHPAARDIVCYIHDHVRNRKKPWSHAHAAGVRWSISAELRRAARDDATIIDPTDADELNGYLRALKRSQRHRRRRVSDPALTEDISAMSQVESVRQRGAGEVIQRRDEVALLLSQRKRIPTRQLMRVRRSHITGGGPRAYKIVLPETPAGGGPALRERTIEICKARDRRLHASLTRLLTLLGDREQLVGDAVFNLLDARGRKPLRTGSPSQCGPAMRLHWEKAAGRAGLTGPIGDPVTVEGVALEWLCDNMNPNLLHDLRDLVTTVLSQDRSRRHAEIRQMRRRDLHPLPGEAPRPDGSFVWVIPTQKNRDQPQTLDIAHLEDCPEHCPACLLGEWLELNDFALDDHVFQSMKPGGRLTGRPVLPAASTNGIRRLAADAGLVGNFSASSGRSGGVTSDILGGASIDEAAEVSGHADRDITYRHYFRPQKLLRAAATRRSAVAVHRIGGEPPGPPAPPPA